VPASAANLAGPWAAPVAVTAVLLFLLVVYVRGWRLLTRESPGRLPVWSLLAFLSGLATVWLAWTARLAAITHYLLIAHMVQHLLLALVAPPLLLLSCPCSTILRGLSLGPVGEPTEIFQTCGLSWARRFGCWLTHPVVAGALMVVVTLAWHIPRIFALAMRFPALHEFENATFLATGILFWWPVILPWPAKQHWPRWAVPLYLLGADMPVSVLCAYLAFCGYVVYPAYLTVPRLFAISPLDDQVAAAMLMWVAMLFVFLAAAVAVVVEVLEPSERLSGQIQGAPLPAAERPAVVPYAISHV
jgi:putative membrane protein